MSMIGDRFSPVTSDPGQTVAQYSSYEAAQKSVSRLIAEDIPAREIAIVGSGLRSVERVTGKLGYATAARSGAINGMLLGLLFAAILVIGSPTVPIQAFVGVLFVGIALGMLMSLVTYSLVRRRRDFASVMQVVAESYQVTVTGSHLAKARQVLGSVAPVPAPVAASRPENEAPPRYGERVPALSSTPDASTERPQESADPPSPRPEVGVEEAADGDSASADDADSSK